MSEHVQPGAHDIPVTSPLTLRTQVLRFVITGGLSADWDGEPRNLNFNLSLAL